MQIPGPQSKLLTQHVSKWDSGVSLAKALCDPYVHSCDNRGPIVRQNHLSPHPIAFQLSEQRTHAIFDSVCSSLKWGEESLHINM